MKVLLFLFVVSLFVWQPTYAQTGNLEVQQNIRNLTQQSFIWANVVEAEPNDRIELQIIVKWSGAQATNNVLVREILDQKLLYEGNLKLDGVPIQGSIISENINIGTLQSNQSKTITFEATVNPSENFAVGLASLINTSTVFNTESAGSVVSKIEVTRQGSPTDISTGPLTIWMIVGFLTVLVVAVSGATFFGRYYIRHRVLESKFETRIDRKLAVSIQRIQNKERKD